MTYFQRQNWLNDRKTKEKNFFRRRICRNGEPDKLLKKPLIGIDPGVKDFLNFYAIAEYGDIKNYGNYKNQLNYNGNYKITKIIYIIQKKETKINPNSKLFKKKVEANDENYLTNAHIKKLRKRARKKEKKKEKNKVKKEQIKIAKPISDQAVPIDTTQEEIKGCYSTKR